MKNKIGLILTVLVTASILWNCTKIKEFFGFSPPPPPPQPILSLADLMIDKLSHSSDSSAKTTLNKIKSLRMYDSIFYKTLFLGASLPKIYFYSRPGSCCPCTSTVRNCCQCSGGTALGVAATAMSQGTSMRRIDRNPIFRFASMSVPKPPLGTLVLDSTVIDGMKIYTVPAHQAAGSYQAFFKGGAINLSLQIDVDSLGIKVSNIH
jgi:hypothetical protein